MDNEIRLSSCIINSIYTDLVKAKRAYYGNSLKRFSNALFFIGYNLSEKERAEVEGINGVCGVGFNYVILERELSKERKKEVSGIACDVLRALINFKDFKELHNKRLNEVNKINKIAEKSCFYFKQMRDFGVVKTTRKELRKRGIDPYRVADTLDELKIKFIDYMSKEFDDSCAII